MQGEFSWLMLIVAFVIVAGLCGILSVRLWRIAGGPAVRGEPASVRSTDESGGRSSS